MIPNGTPSETETDSLKKPHRNWKLNLRFGSRKAYEAARRAAKEKGQSLNRFVLDGVSAWITLTTRKKEKGVR